MPTSIGPARNLPRSASKPRVGSLFPNFLCLEPRPVHVTFENDGPGHLSRRGPRHDNDHVNFQDIQILPTVDEILAVHRSPYMPKKNIKEPNHLRPGPHRLLDTLFRHLRHDSIEGVRDVCYHAAQQLVKEKDVTLKDYEPRQETPAGNRYFLYSNVKFEEILSDEKRGIIFRLSYDCPEFMRGRGMIRSGRLEQGMLCALLGLDEDGKSLSATFFDVYMAQSTDSMTSKGGRGVRAAVQVAFTQPAKHENVRRMLRSAQGLSLGKYVLVEIPKLLYAGFYYCLDTLQRIKSTDMAFAEYIAPRVGSLTLNSLSRVIPPALTQVSPPSYCTKPDFRFDVGCLAKNETNFSLSEIQNEPANFIQFLKQKTTLDDGQAVALQNCLTKELAFTQGPPGTGKTYLGVALTRVLLASRSNIKLKPILVVCLTNHALDSFLAGLLDAGVSKVARIGRGSKEEWIKKFELHAISRNTKLTQDIWQAKSSAIHTSQTLYTEMEAGCKGLNAEMTTGALSWPSVEAYLRSNHTQIYEQLTTSNNNRYTQSFAFDYWAGGGDLRNLRELRAELEACLLGTSANDGTSISTEGIDRALEQISLHAQQESTRAEQNNIWKLNLRERQQMLRQWKSDVNREALVEHFTELQVEHQSARQAVRKSWHKRDAKCLLEQDVIGLTTTACASNWEMLKTLELEIVICEEAGEVMEAHTICSLFPSIQHAIFIGDPQQLRPEVNEQNMSLETTIGSQYRLDESLFERCMMPTDPMSRPMPTSHLNIQRRMHPDIADITRLVYPYLQDHPSTLQHPPTDGIAERMFWIDHRMPEADPSAASKSHINPYEVEMVTAMVQYLVRGNAYSLGDIAILTPYNGQLAALHESLKKTCSVWLSEKDRQALLDDGLLEESEEDKPRAKDELSMSNLLRIATIDNFQGEEAKVVVLSTVRSGGRPGFLKTMNRINVACSRARDGFYIVGNSQTLGKVPMWRQIIELFASRGRIGANLRICCSRHPDHCKDIVAPQDFDRVQECKILCGHILPCGHSCQEPCHPPELHERLPCTSRCNHIHPCGHQCLKLCSEPCGPCTYPIKQQILPCGHAVDILCSGGIPTCTEPIDTCPLPCGHLPKILCCDRGKPYSCDEKCGKNLPCGHPCQGLCVDCRASISALGHQPCSNKCGKKFPDCGHYCDSECHTGSPCPPCKQPCQEKCEHGSCKNLCSEPCDPCVKSHKRPCSHQVESSLFCTLPSDILPCCEGCDKVLQCGHTCPSFCGEVCPKKCPLCTSASELADSVLVCPQCDAVLDIKDLDRFVSDIYSIDENGKIIAFTSKSQSSRDIKNFSCGCRAPLHIIRRYSILKKINQAPAVFERLLVKIGRALNGFSRRIHSTEKDLDESFFNFRTQIRPNPLAAGQNKALISSRAQDLLRLSDCIHDYNISTVIPFEKSISWLQSTIPSALAPLTNHTIQSTFSLRLSILHRRARNLWISDCLRVSKYLVSLSDPSLELQRMSSLLRVRASKECWKGISDCEDALRRKEIKNAPGIEVEIRLQQIQLSHMLDIALSAGDSGESADVEVEDDNEAMAMPSMSPDAPSDSLKHAVQLCRRYPDTAGKFAGLVNGFAKYKDEMMKMDGRKKMRGANANGNANTDLNVYALATLPRTCNTETRKLEWSWGEYVGGGLKVCSKAGHLYSRNWTTTVKIDKDASGCLECGGREMRGVKLVGGMDGEVSDQGQAEKEAVRKAGSCLFEDRFLEAMRGKGK